MSDERIITEGDAERFRELIEAGEEFFPEMFGKCEFYRGAVHTLVAFNQGYEDGRDVEELVTQARIGLEMLMDADARMVDINRQATNLVSSEDFLQLDSKILGIWAQRKDQVRQTIMHLIEVFAGTLVGANDAIDQVEKFDQPLDFLSSSAGLFQRLRPFKDSLEVGSPPPINAEVHAKAMEWITLPPGLRKMLGALGLGPNDLGGVENILINADGTVVSADVPNPPPAPESEV